MLKLEIKLDEFKIQSKHKYDADSIYQALEKSFLKHDIPMTQEIDGTLVFCGKGRPSDYGADEEDYSVEDVLYFYTKRDSVA